MFPLHLIPHSFLRAAFIRANIPTIKAPQPQKKEMQNSRQRPGAHSMSRCIERNGIKAPCLRTVSPSLVYVCCTTMLSVTDISIELANINPHLANPDITGSLHTHGLLELICHFHHHLRMRLSSRVEGRGHWESFGFGSLLLL